MSKTVIKLDLPPNSRCVQMAAGKDFFMVLFDIPKRGVVPFIIYPNGDAKEIIFSPDDLACPTNTKG
jgi:hypothetical protein